jgi:predicted DNA-binding transcriptional regulator AlpA
MAAFLGVTEATLADWRYRGRHGPAFVKVGRLVRYRLEDLDAWLDAQRTAGARP